MSFSRFLSEGGVLQARKLACTRREQEGMEDFVCNVAGAEAEGATGTVTNAAPQVVEPPHLAVIKWLWVPELLHLLLM